eukprot:156997-Amphidinium_carterae.1
MAATIFELSHNRLSGRLPGSGMRAMVAVARFRIFSNCFTGALPDDGARTMPLQDLSLSGNGFTGSFPEGMFVQTLRTIDTVHNYFAGTLAKSLPCSNTRASLGGLAIVHPKFFGSFLSFPQDVASCDQSRKPGKD